MTLGLLTLHLRKHLKKILQRVTDFRSSGCVHAGSVLLHLSSPLPGPPPAAAPLRRAGLPRAQAPPRRRRCRPLGGPGPGGWRRLLTAWRPRGTRSGGPRAGPCPPSATVRRTSARAGGLRRAGGREGRDGHGQPAPGRGPRGCSRERGRAGAFPGPGPSLGLGLSPRRSLALGPARCGCETSVNFKTRLSAAQAELRNLCGCCLVPAPCCRGPAAVWVTRLVPPARAGALQVACGAQQGPGCLRVPQPLARRRAAAAPSLLLPPETASPGQRPHSPSPK